MSQATIRDINTDPATAAARQKIVPIDELAARIEAAKAAGKKVVYAHGVFDLLHVGHVRHLEAARRQGSFLVVTITADKFVNKGPGRPVFPEHLRAEMLGALVHVDLVAVNHAMTAENVLRQIKPDVYVKGAEYADASADVTGKITAEREAIEAHGGQVVFTDEETYSSSVLLNRHFSLHEPTVQRYLDTLREAGVLAQLLKEIEALSKLKVLLIGDAIIDEYQYVAALGRPSKETIIATQFKDREVFAGGAIAAANHVAGFCGEVELITALGENESYEDLVRGSLKDNVKLTHIVRKGAPTTRKTRFVDMGYSLKKLFEVYVMDDAPLPAAEQDKLNALMEERLSHYDLVIVTDFGHGLLHGSTVDLLTRKAPFLAVNTQTNSANHGYNLISKYRRADYICLDGPEARLAIRNKYANTEELVLRLPEVIDCNKTIVTLGKNGCLSYDRSVHASDKAAGLNQVPALTNTIVDTVGAGDAFFAVTAPMVFRGLSLATVGFLGNVAGAMKVGIVGHRSFIERAPFLKYLTALLK
jgi:rfaE bifunctional protein nucleotidyltransferase chain/domain